MKLLKDELEDIRRQNILAALKQSKGNQRHACELLRMPKSTLNEWIRRNGVDVKEFAPDGIVVKRKLLKKIDT